MVILNWNKHSKAQTADTMDHRNKKSRPEGRAAGLSLLTIVSIAGTVICITKARADFIDRYADLGLSGAIFSYRLPLAFAACAVIFSLIYLAERSISKAQRKSTRRSLIRQANEAGLNPMILEEADEQAKARIDRLHRLNLHKLRLIPRYVPEDDADRRVIDE